MLNPPFEYCDCSYSRMPNAQQISIRSSLKSTVLFRFCRRKRPADSLVVSHLHHVHPDSNPFPADLVVENSCPAGRFARHLVPTHLWHHRKHLWSYLLCPLSVQWHQSGEVNCKSCGDVRRDRFPARTCTVSQLLWCQASPVHVLVSCDVVWPPVSLTLCVWGRSSKVCVGTKLLFCRGHGRFVNSWPVRWGEETSCFVLSAEENHTGGRGMTPASYMYIHTIYRYDKLLNV